jgi:acyl dehydratase
MGVSSLHVLQQGPVVGALGRTVAMALGSQLTKKPSARAPITPGPEITRTARALPQSLLDDYVKHVGGDPRAYRGQVPPHLFPQWCMPVLARTLEGLPYPLLRVVNGGCHVRVHAPLPAGEPLTVRAQLRSVDDDGTRAVLHQHVATGTSSAPDALEIDFQAVVPLATRRVTRPSREVRSAHASPAASRKVKPHAPDDAREILRVHLPHDAGLSFAKLTGDFNPIHWVPAYARASGFPDVILHGFGTLARAWEALNRGVFAGDVQALTSLECRLTRPLVLPHDVSFFVRGRELFVADAPMGPAYLTGTFQTRGGS